MTPKKYLTYVFGTLIVFGLVLGIVIGCMAFVHEVTKERPHFNSGKVIANDYNPAHYDDWTENRYIGETCSGTSPNRVCTPLYMPVFHHDYVADKWSIQIQNCNVSHKDGTQWVDKTGAAKCFTKWITVDETDYHKFTGGKQWGVEG